MKTRLLFISLIILLGMGKAIAGQDQQIKLSFYTNEGNYFEIYIHAEQVLEEDVAITSLVRGKNTKAFNIRDFIKTEKEVYEKEMDFIQHISISGK
jgi:hypothetical protein